MTTIPRYPPTYRQAELRLVCSNALRGQSMGFVGIAGTGKSNMVRYLRDRIHLDRHLGANVDQVHFAEVNTIDWSGTPEHLWHSMTGGLLKAIRQMRLRGDTQRLDRSAVGSQPAPPIEELKTWIDYVCQDLGYKLMFVLDDFDEVIARNPAAMLESLSKFRTDGNTEHLSYLVFTKRLPHVLGRSYHFHLSQFYRLFKDHIYALGLYSDADARQMLEFLNSNAMQPLNPAHLSQIQALAGGHAGLLKVLFNAWSTAGDLQGHLVYQFAANPDVQWECQRILEGLHKQEQATAIALATNRQAEVDTDIVDHLLRRGILTGPAGRGWFSPLMPAVLQILYPR